jgi:Tfp pilus assembly protein PilF
MGVVKSNQKRFVEAIDYFQQVLVHQPQHDRAHYALAIIYHHLGDKSLSTEHLHKAIAAGLVIKQQIIDQLESRN